MVITLIGLTIIGFICVYTYIETDRQEIQKKQEALQRDLDALKECIKDEERKRHEEVLKRYDEIEGV